MENMEKKNNCPTDDSRTKKDIIIKELTCINCPLGCALTAEMCGAQILSVTGNTCPRGAQYAAKELTDPRRIVTTTVRVKGESEKGGTGGRAVSVKTKSDIPKDKIMACILALKDVEVHPPIHIGDVILPNIADTGVDVVATKNYNK